MQHKSTTENGMKALKRYNLYLPTAMIARLEHRAKKSYTSVSQLVRDAIEQYLAKIEKARKRQ